MQIYLTIMVTVLVLSQIVRVAQNHIQLRRQNTLFKAQLGQISDITEDDLQRQRETYKLLYAWLEKEMADDDR